MADETTFYSNAEGYWKEVPPTVDGMLGGYGTISSIDINGSKAFLKKLLGVRKEVAPLDQFDWEVMITLCHIKTMNLMTSENFRLALHLC